MPKGVHVANLTAADLTVKEGGKDRAIEALRPARAPMQLSILVDDGGTGGFLGVVVSSSPIGRRDRNYYGEDGHVVHTLREGSCHPYVHRRHLPGHGQQPTAPHVSAMSRDINLSAKS